jgi:Tol biopolymer transport system component
MKLEQAKSTGLLILTATVVALALGGCAQPTETEAEAETAEPESSLLLPEEVHLRNLRQLTFGGENAEAYWSADGKKLIFQSKRDGLECDQIFVMDVESGAVEMVSNGKGKTTCSFFFPDGERIVYSSTFEADEACPAPPDYSKGYVWKLHPEFDVFTSRLDGSDLRRLTDTPGYDAEATISPDGSTIIFTSLRDGDLDLYTMDADGNNVTRLTDELGYDGGAFYSRDGKRIVWRASRPSNEEELADYQTLLETSAIRPMNLEVFVANADGSDARQVTSNGHANFAPYFFPDGKRIIFVSNMSGEARNFDVWTINDDGTELEQITFYSGFDGFPMFSPDGKYLVFASNRGGSEEGETNVFLAEWVD